MNARRMLALAIVVVAATSPALAQNSPITFRGTTSLPSGVSSQVVGGDDALPKPFHPGHSAADVHPSLRSQAPVAAAPVSIPTPHPQGVVRGDDEFFGFSGLNHFDQRFAGTGAYANTQLSLVPPDQGLCVGNGLVGEVINNALALYSEAGTLLAGPVAFSQFWGLHPEVIRSNPSVFGEFISDPRCYFDPASRRWFITELEFGRNPSTGAFTAPSSILIAVSKTSNPVGAYFLYSFDTTDGDGTVPGHPHCPCFGDQPLIGADANGFYVSTNEFPINGPGFNGSQIYAISKARLVAGTASTVIHINAGTIPVPPQDAGNVWYSIQPSTSPGSTGNESGTEYFLSALQFGPAPYDNRIAVWALTNTESLNSHSPHLHLRHTVINTESYGMDPSGFFAAQKSGSTPLRDALGDTDPLETITANDDRMNQLVYANGLLWSGVNTSVSVNGKTLIGIAWFAISPSLGEEHLSASVHRQDYAAVAGEDVMFPSIGVNQSGNAVMSFTLVGPDYWPSTAYASVKNQTGNIRVAGAGVGPIDDFDGYAAEGGASPVRWGDYSAAVADSDGNIWVAAEYVGQTCSLAQFLSDTTCGHTRSLLANWGTFIRRVSTGD